MNYIYDIMVNFKYPLFDFYEWNQSDEIENIKRIPLFKITKEDLQTLKYSKFKIKDINSIKNITKLFNNKKKTYNASVYTDGNEAIVFNFDDNGICISKSSLLLDEELEVIEGSKIINTTSIDYEVLSKDNSNKYMTRKQIEITDFLINTINEIKDLDKLNYLYFECFNKDNNLTKEEFIKMIKNNWDDKYYKMWDFLHSISMNKK